MRFRDVYPSAHDVRNRHRTPRRNRTGRLGTRSGRWILADVLAGVLLQLTAPQVIVEAVPGMYGVEGVAVGWTIHLVHCALFGLAYAGVVRFAPPRASTGLARGAVAGAVYGTVLWAVVAATVVPLWLGTIGHAAAPTFPYLDAFAFAAYDGFGTVVGTVYALAT